MAAGTRVPAVTGNFQGVEKVNRLDYIKYDQLSMNSQANFKAMFLEITKEMLEELPDGRSRDLALDRLEEAYCWVGKSIRDWQISRELFAAESPARGPS